MRAPRLYQTEAIVLKRSDLNEADRIVTLYTPHRGKIRAIAKGSRRPLSKLAGHLELYTHSIVLIACGRHLDIVSQSQTIDSFVSLREDLEKSVSALYVMEVVDQFTEDGVEDYPVFKLILETLQRLVRPGDDNLILRYFDLHFLEFVGYRPQLQHCIHCEDDVQPITNFFSASSGGVLCPRCRAIDPTARPISVNALKVLRHLQNGEDWLIDRLKMSRPLAAEMESLSRGYIRYLLDKDVKSAVLLDSLHQSQL